MHKGYIRLWRKFKDWEWYDVDNMVRVFIHLLIHANYTDKPWRGKLIKKSQFWTSIDKLSKELNLSYRSIRTCLDNLEKTNEITRKPTNEGTMVTLVNFDTYNDEETITDKRNDNPTANHRQTTDKPPTTTNHYNHLNNSSKKDTTVSKKEIPTFQDGVDAFINFATNYFRDAGENYDYNRLKLEAEEFAGYWFSAKQGCKTQWEKKKRSDLKATARSRFADRVGKIKKYDGIEAKSSDDKERERIRRELQKIEMRT